MAVRRPPLPARTERQFGVAVSCGLAAGVITLAGAIPGLALTMFASVGAALVADGARRRRWRAIEEAGLTFA